MRNIALLLSFLAGIALLLFTLWATGPSDPNRDESSSVTQTALNEQSPLEATLVDVETK